MADPLFWLGLSILLVAVSLAAVLIVALPALQELARAARSAEKLFDTLSRELPPTLEAIRLTGLEITNLTDDVSQNVQSAGRIVEQVDQSLSGMKQQARQAQSTTRSVVAGVKAAWQVFTKPTPPATRSRNFKDSENRQRTNATPALDLSSQSGDRVTNSFETALVESERLKDQPLPDAGSQSFRLSAPDGSSSNSLEARRLPNDRRSWE